MLAAFLLLTVFVRREAGLGVGVNVLLKGSQSSFKSQRLVVLKLSRPKDPRTRGPCLGHSIWDWRETLHLL